jgi:hypothetical protein
MSLAFRLWFLFGFRFLFLALVGSRYLLLSFALAFVWLSLLIFGSFLVLVSHFCHSFTSFVYCFYLLLLALTWHLLFTLFFFLLTLLIYGSALGLGSTSTQASTLDLATAICFIY